MRRFAGSYMDRLKRKALRGRLLMSVRPGAIRCKGLTPVSYVRIRQQELYWGLMLVVYGHSRRRSVPRRESLMAAVHREDSERAVR